MYAINSNIFIHGKNSFADNWAASNGGEKVWEHGIHEWCHVKQDETGILQ